jgi:hypothetical protein
VGNSLSGRLKKPVTIDLDPQEHGLAALFAKFMVNDDLIPHLTSYLGLDAEQIPEIEAGLRDLNNTYPAAAEFVDRLLDRFVPGKKSVFKPKHKKTLRLGQQMWSYVEQMWRAADEKGAKRLTIKEITNSSHFKKRFLEGRGNARTRHDGRHMTPEWSIKLIRRARKSPPAPR